MQLPTRDKIVNHRPQGISTEHPAAAIEVSAVGDEFELSGVPFFGQLLKESMRMPDVHRRIGGTVEEEPAEIRPVLSTKLSDRIKVSVAGQE